MMHKYFARRPWNVFSELIAHYSFPGELILDPFCGGGTTVVESMKLGRRAIGVDSNSLATYITEMECRLTNRVLLRDAFLWLTRSVKPAICSLYHTTCRICGGDAFDDWIQWDEERRQMIKVKYTCPKCERSQECPPRKVDIVLAAELDRDFAEIIRAHHLWFPRTPIPRGDKTDSLLRKNVSHFHQLFTKRNLTALSMLSKSIENIKDTNTREFLEFALSGSLKWASRQSHLRGQIVEGWAMHAYWIYPKTLEINVWNIFEKRARSILRGKKYHEENIGASRLGMSYADLVNGRADCLILNRSSSSLPIPDDSVHAIITDPPYGNNVNYGELSDFWYVWTSKGKLTDKALEVVINRTQGKTLADYENLLYLVFKECYRVLKQRRYLVCTFNSRDLRVVTSFIMAVSRSGFELHPKGLLYQSPIRAYATTMHAMQIGAFVGDFIFTFVKGDQPTEQIHRQDQPRELRKQVPDLIVKGLRTKMTEVEIRRSAYSELIPFVARYARSDPQACRAIADSFESLMSESDDYFRKQRMKIVERRRNVFRKDSCRDFTLAK